MIPEQYSFLCAMLDFQSVSITLCSTRCAFSFYAIQRNIHSSGVPLYLKEEKCASISERDQGGAWAIGGTEPGALVHAEGELDGVPFSQRDYWKLLYSPLHHHIGFDFAVLFETPIGLACGIKVEAKYGEPVLHTVACDLANIEARTVDDYLLSIPQL